MRLGILFSGALFIFLLGTWVTAFVPLADQSLFAPRAGVLPYTDKEEQGRLVYQREGCWYCHSQYTRVVAADQNENLGSVSEPGDYIYRQPALLGSERTGPDLMWVGDRLPSAQWHAQHLYDPPSVSPGSIMPRFTWLFTGYDQAAKKPIPTADGDALITYLLSLKVPVPIDAAVAQAAKPSGPPTTALGEGGDPANGQKVFSANACSSCHPVQPGQPGAVAPNLSNIGNRAANAKPGYSAGQYAHESVVDPNATIAAGYQPDVMPKGFGQTIQEKDLNDLVAYLLTLKSGQD